jgi:hypothetical protein
MNGMRASNSCSRTWSSAMGETETPATDAHHWSSDRLVLHLAGKHRTRELYLGLGSRIRPHARKCIQTLLETGVPRSGIRDHAPGIELGAAHALALFGNCPSEKVDYGPSSCFHLSHRRGSCFRPKHQIASLIFRHRRTLSHEL